LRSAPPPHGESISVVIASYRRPEHLRACILAVLGQTEPPTEIVVVLRPSDLAGQEVARRFGASVTCVAVEEAGQVAALNAGLTATRGTLVAMVDDDAEPRVDWAQTIRTWFEADTAVGGVGGRDIIHDGDTTLAGTTDVVGRVRWWTRLVGRHHLESAPQRVMFLKGANMTYRRSALAGFDPRLRGSGAQVCNDLDVSLGAHAAGWTLIYDPLVAVDHYPAARAGGAQRGQTQSLSARCDEHHNELYVLLKHLPRWQRPLAVAYRIGVGYRHAPGLAFGLMLAVTRPRAGSNAVAHLTRSRLQAVVTWLRWRTDERRCRRRGDGSVS
jgi:cellulose synthase/poly-beta-1,6-N-acetylglucosamine synthase-like glycosyltransferase